MRKIKRASCFLAWKLICFFPQSCLCYLIKREHGLEGFSKFQLGLSEGMHLVTLSWKWNLFNGHDDAIRYCHDVLHPALRI